MLKMFMLDVTKYYFLLYPNMKFTGDSKEHLAQELTKVLFSVFLYEYSVFISKPLRFYITVTQTILALPSGGSLSILQNRPYLKGTVLLVHIVRAYVYYFTRATREKNPRGKYFIANRYD